MENFYELLGLKHDADERAIKKAYHILVKQYHPDSPRSKNLSEAQERFKAVKEAYETLINRESRKAYDKYVLKKASILFKPKGKKEPYRINKAKEYYKHGREEYRAKNFSSASRAFQTALNLDPDNALYCSWFGLTLSNIKGKLQEAKKWCKKAVELSPDNADFQINLAIIYRDAGLTSAAERLFRRALELEPHNKRAYSWLKEKKEGPSIKELFKGIFKREKK